MIEDALDYATPTSNNSYCIAIYLNIFIKIITIHSNRELTQYFSFKLSYINGNKYFCFLSIVDFYALFSPIFRVTVSIQMVTGKLQVIIPRSG